MKYGKLVENSLQHRKYALDHWPHSEWTIFPLMEKNQ